MASSFLSNFAVLTGPIMESIKGGIGDGRNEIDIIY